MKRMLVLTIAMSGLLSLLNACNTMAGLGQDIEKGGRKLERKANESK